MRTRVVAIATGLMVAAGMASIAVGPAAAAFQSGPSFHHDGGGVSKPAVRLTGGSTTFTLLGGLARVSCRSVKGAGTILAATEQHVIGGLSLSFHSCTARNVVTGHTCRVHGTRESANAIVTPQLSGELVAVGFPETYSGVGLALGPERSGKPFLTFEASAADNCLPVPRRTQRRVTIYGRVIGEVGFQFGDVRTTPLYFEAENGGYFESGQRIQHPLGGLQQVLSSFGLETPMQSFPVLRFAESVQIY